MVDIQLSVPERYQLGPVKHDFFVLAAVSGEGNLSLIHPPAARLIVLFRHG